MRHAIRTAMPVLLCLALVMATPGAARAGIVNFSCFPVESTQVVPPSAAPGSGYGDCTLDTATNLFSWEIDFNTFPLGTGHTDFHVGPPGVDGPVTIPTGSGSPAFGSHVLTPAQAADVLAGNWYFEVTSPTLPGKALRGQVLNTGCKLKSFGCVELTGAQVVPPVASPGSGLATFVLNETANERSHFVTWSGLSGPPTAVHLHQGAPGTNGLLLQTFSLSSNPISGGSSITESGKANLLAGNWYVDIHTALFPDGEVRGQIVDTGCMQWTDLGHALTSHTVGPPQLIGEGTMVGGSSNRLHLFNGLAGSSFVFLGGLPIDAPFKGGVMVPLPQFKVTEFISSAGTGSLPFTWPADPGLVGLDVYWQQWFPDPQGVAGVAASNGLKSTGQ